MRYMDEKGGEIYPPPDIHQSTKGKLTKDMARNIRLEVDESKMGEEREYWGGGKDFEDDDYGGVGDRTRQ